MENDRLIIPFVKMTGAGNDFVLIDNLEQQLQLDWSAFASAVCNRRYGIGADGLLVIEKSTVADFTMNYFNADGSYGGMCGNGGRCSSKYVMGISNLHKIRFNALDYIYEAEKSSTQVKLHMKNPSSIKTNIQLAINVIDLSAYFINTGSPHVVVALHQQSAKLKDEIHRNGIIGIGRAIRNHSNFSPHGTNVNFTEITENSVVSMRTYERGVEDETLACGTGAVASAICVSQLSNISSPVTIKTRSNEFLKVYFQKDGEQFSSVILEGPAIEVFRGYLHYSLNNNKILPK